MVLFDKQAQHHRQSHAQPPAHSLHTVEEEDWSWNEDASWDWQDPWALMAWENGDWGSYYHHDTLEETEGAPTEDGTAAQPPAQEALAADRSWSQAQQAK